MCCLIIYTLFDFFRMTTTMIIVNNSQGILLLFIITLFYIINRFVFKHIYVIRRSKLLTHKIDRYNSMKNPCSIDRANVNDLILQRAFITYKAILIDLILITITVNICGWLLGKEKLVYIYGLGFSWFWLYIPLLILLNIIIGYLYSKTLGKNWART